MTVPKRLLAALALVLGLSWPGLAAADAADGRHLGERVMSYYVSPDPHAAFGWLTTVDPATLERPEGANLIAVFYQHLLQADPGLLPALVAAVSPAETPAPTVAVAATAIWMSGVAGREAAVERLAAGGRIPPDRLEVLRGFPVFSKQALVAMSPHHLDLCWVSFFATGDTDYVAKVAAILPALLPPDRMDELAARDDPESGRAFRRALMAGAAAWSLVANARSHPAVRLRLEAIAAGDDQVANAVRALLDHIGER